MNFKESLVYNNKFFKKLEHNIINASNLNSEDLANTSYIKKVDR
jgi:hypothetical protein